MSARPVTSISGQADTTPHDLFTVLTEDADPARRQQARQDLIELHRGLAERLARRFRNRGEPLEDLCQVATIGLIKAVDGFDPVRGDHFIGYAVPTILGELRRHFRDRGWDVRVPRRCQELSAEIASTTERLTHELGRTPSTGDLAEALGTTVREIDETLVAGQAYSALSLHRPLRDGEPASSIADMLATDEDGYDQVDARLMLRQVLADLPWRERHILGLRYYHQLTQSEIADEVGVSQMHVSRLLSRSLEQLRVRVLSPAA